MEASLQNRTPGIQLVNKKINQFKEVNAFTTGRTIAVRSVSLSTQPELGDSSTIIPLLLGVRMADPALVVSGGARHLKDPISSGH